MVKRIAKQAAFALIPLSILSALVEPVKLPSGILAGGILALLNLRGMSKGLEGLLGTFRPEKKLLLLSIFRLLVLSALIVLLAVLELVNLVGFTVGFTVVLFFVLMEGARAAGEDADADRQ